MGEATASLARTRRTKRHDTRCDDSLYGRKDSAMSRGGQGGVLSQCIGSIRAAVTDSAAQGLIVREAKKLRGGVCV